MTIACSGLAGYIHRMIRRTALLFLFLASIHAHAQNATITSFRYNTMDTAYSIYGDTSTVYVYKGADGGLAVIPTADTMYRHSVAAINEQLNCTIENLNVDGTANDGSKERIVGYAECALAIIGTDNWMNERYFRARDMRPLFVEELAVDPEFQGRGLGSFVLEQLEHLARLRGCTHLVLEVAENNDNALKFYRSRSFTKLDAAIFLAKTVVSDPEILPPRRLKRREPRPQKTAGAAATAPSEPKDRPPEG